MRSSSWNRTGIITARRMIPGFVSNDLNKFGWDSPEGQPPPARLRPRFL